jgi:predicted esterase YcpF (UPF0227 family)
MGLIVFFHGLESGVSPDKLKYLKDRYGDVYYPDLDYRTPNLFNELYNQLKNQKIDIISGSSMGGYFAYWMGKKLGVNTLLFNPAIVERYSIEPVVDKSGSKTPHHNLILGVNDNVIKIDDTIKWFEDNEKPSNYTISLSSQGHRTPFNIFKKYFVKFG